jgi:membrane protein
MLDRLLGPLGRRWPAVGTALDVQKRFSELHGGYLASALTLATFLSVFPLILVAIAVLGFVSVNNTHVASDIISNLGLRGTAAQSIKDTINAAEHSRRATSVIGVVGLLWTGLGVVTATQLALDAVWQRTGRTIRDRGIGVIWVAGSGVLMAVSFAISSGLNFLPGVLAPLVLVVGAAYDVGQFLFTFKVLGRTEPVGWRALLPGAIAGGIGLQVLKVFGSFYLPRAVHGSSQLYGPLLGVIFAILAWLFLFGRLVVYSAVLNVVLWEKDHGTLTTVIEVPRLPGESPKRATRAGEAVAS